MKTVKRLRMKERVARVLTIFPALALEITTPDEAATTLDTNDPIGSGFGTFAFT